VVAVRASAAAALRALDRQHRASAAGVVELALGTETAGACLDEVIAVQLPGPHLRRPAPRDGPSASVDGYTGGLGVYGIAIELRLCGMSVTLGPSIVMKIHILSS
jgi:hypothetical protein